MSGWRCALYLEKGHLFVGDGVGARTVKGGEAVFNTGLSGYQEIFTDPSYRRQIVVMTYPHIGNTGVNLEDPESKGLDLAGVAMRSYNPTPSNWRSRMSLNEYLTKAGIPGISDIDTRELTRLLRDEGAQRAVLFPVDDEKADLSSLGKTLLKDVPAMEGLELVSEVSCKEPYLFEGSERGTAGTIVAYDFGVKHNILRGFRDRGFRVQVVPYHCTFQQAQSYKPVAIALTNGPGDPAMVGNTVSEIQAMIGKIPIFAVCMGHQLLARALGAKTYKLKFGHHGCNHPVQDRSTGRILITSQNHGFSVHAEDLKSRDIDVRFVSLNDHTTEGFVSEKMRLHSVQFHPEAKPGPNDASYLFDTFIKGFLK